MKHVERCPICYGSGKISPPHQHYTTTYIPQPTICHACGGMGVFFVDDEPSVVEEKPIAAAKKKPTITLTVEDGGFRIYNPETDCLDWVSSQCPQKAAMRAASVLEFAGCEVEVIRSKA